MARKIPPLWAALRRLPPTASNSWGARQGNSHAITTAAAAEARIDKAVQEVYERFETACDDLDSGLFDLDQPHCYCCMQFFCGAGSTVRRNVGGHV